MVEKIKEIWKKGGTKGKVLVTIILTLIIVGVGFLTQGCIGSIEKFQKDTHIEFEKAERTK